MFLKTFCFSIVATCFLIGCSTKPDFLHKTYEFSFEKEGTMFKRTTSTLVSPNCEIEIHFDIIQLNLNEKAANHFNQKTAQQFSCLKSLLTSREWKEPGSRKLSSPEEMNVMIGWNMRHDGVFFTDEDCLNISNGSWNERIQTRCRVPFISSVNDTEFISMLPTIIAKL
jgi:hypothetical protein